MNPTQATTHRESLPGYPGQGQCPYLVIRDAETVKEVLHRPDDFSPANALEAVTPLTGASLRVLQSVGFALPPVLASNDTNTHAGIRKVVAGYFTPATVTAMEPRIRELAREAATTTAHKLQRTGHAELVRDVAAFTPAIVMFELLGLPVRDLAKVKGWGLESMELFWGWPDESRQLELARSAAEFYVWLRQLVTESLTTPGRNLFKSLAGHGLTLPEICSLGYFLLIAGQETTTQLISTALFRLLEGSLPWSWTAAATEEGARAAIRRTLTTESSVPTWRRTTTQDISHKGQIIPAGTEILLELSGNTITRPPEPGMSARKAAAPERGHPDAYKLVFGSGIHRCLGAKLAELEAALIIQETASALPDIRLRNHQPQWISLLSFQAPRSIDIQNAT